MLEFAVRFIAFVLGFFAVVGVILSAIRTFVLPRSAREWLTGLVFRTSRKVFDLLARRTQTYEQRDSLMAMYAPITLLLLPLVWVFLVLMGYAAIFWAVEYGSFEHALLLSGSSLLTLGFEKPDTLLMVLIAFSEASIGLILVALLISYLPTMYGAFSRRETAVTLLEVRAGSPPSAVVMLKRLYGIRGLVNIHDLWTYWETVFAEIEETHTSLAALAFFRSPNAHRSWVTASGTVLDAAALYLSAIDEPFDPQAALTIRAGFVALRHVADFFRISYDDDPHPTDPISVTRTEFDAAHEDMQAAGVPIRENRDTAWRDYAGWRVNYDTVLLALAGLTMAPYAPWISDRSVPRWQRPKTPKALANLNGELLGDAAASTGGIDAVLANDPADARL
jgi:hypothetical protein